MTTRQTIWHLRYGKEKTGETARQKIAGRFSQIPFITFGMLFITRVIVEVDLRSDKTEERREIFVDARDLQSDDGNGNKLSAAQYKALLVQRGKEKLIEYQKVETVTSSVDSHANLEYKKDYDLGDYCTYINTEIGIETAQRITEIMETYEGGSIELIVTFGNEGVTTVKQLIKREAA